MPVTSQNCLHHPLLSELLILFCAVQKILFPIDDFRFLFHKKKYNPLLLTVPPFSHLTSCTPIKSNLYLANSLATVLCDPHIPVGNGQHLHCIFRPPLHPHAGMKLQAMAKVVKHLEPLQVRALGCGMPLQAMLRPVMPHQEGKHRVMTKELQVGGTDGMKHPKQREVRYFKCACCCTFSCAILLAAGDVEWEEGAGGVILLNITFSFYIYFIARFQRVSAIITWRCWKWLHSVTVFEELGILKETGHIGNCIVAGKCNQNLDWRDWNIKKHLVCGFVINSKLLVLKKQHFWGCKKQFLYISESW